MITDDYIEEIFQGTNFGEGINNSTQKKKELLAKTLKNQMDGYWSGHTAYWIAINGGFLIDGKRSANKKLTYLGYKFMEIMGQ